MSLYGNRGMLLDLGPYVESGAIDTTYISESELAGGMLNGKLLAINLGSNAMVGIYDPELFAQAGIEPPGPEWTWEDYIESAVLLLTSWVFIGRHSSPATSSMLSTMC